MNTRFDSGAGVARGIRGGRRALLRGLLALACTMPGAAYPTSLSQLLRLPFEQLLRLEISSPLAAPNLQRGPAPTRPTADRGSRP